MTNEEHLKRLKYRSSHRGCKETDLVLGPFAERQLPLLGADMVGVYEELLEENDWDIWNWLIGKTATPEPYKKLMALILHDTDPSLRGGEADAAIQ